MRQDSSEINNDLSVWDGDRPLYTRLNCDSANPAQTDQKTQRAVVPTCCVHYVVLRHHKPHSGTTYQQI